MPFTIAHTAAALPLKKIAPGWFSLTGLMAGALSPDLLYFLIMTTADRSLSHSWLGLVVFCVPAGVAFALAFHALFKYQVIINLPSPLDERLSGLAVSRFWPLGVKQWVILAVSVAVGALSHFGWDAFTHAHGTMVPFFPFLTKTVEIFGEPVAVTTVAQHGSTLAGFVVMGLAVWNGWLMPGPVELPEKRSAGQKWGWWIGAVVFAAGFAAVVTIIYDVFFMERVVTRFTTFGLAGFAGFFWSVVGYGLVRRRLSAEVAEQPVSVPLRSEE